MVQRSVSKVVGAFVVGKSRSNFYQTFAFAFVLMYVSVYAYRFYGASGPCGNVLILVLYCLIELGAFWNLLGQQQTFTLLCGTLFPCLRFSPLIDLCLQYNTLICVFFIQSFQDYLFVILGRILLSALSYVRCVIRFTYITRPRLSVLSILGVQSNWSVVRGMWSDWSIILGA